MDPVSRCLRDLDPALNGFDAVCADRVNTALDTLEACYRRPSERIVALEAVLQAFFREHDAGGATPRRFLRIAVDRRQGNWAWRSEV